MKVLKAIMCCGVLGVALAAGSPKTEIEGIHNRIAALLTKGDYDSVVKIFQTSFAKDFQTRENHRKMGRAKWISDMNTQKMIKHPPTVFAYTMSDWHVDKSSVTLTSKLTDRSHKVSMGKNHLIEHVRVIKETWIQVGGHWMAKFWDTQSVTMKIDGREVGSPE